MSIFVNNQEGKSGYIAKCFGGREESVEKHSRNVAFLAESYAPEKLKYTTKLAGDLHDSGKNCDKFLQYIRKAAEDPGSVKVGKVTHSTAGGIIVDGFAGTGKAELFTAEIIRHAIISHHGIYDFVTPEGKRIFDLRVEKQQGMDDISREVYLYLPEEELRRLFAQSTAELTEVERKIIEITNGNNIGEKSFYRGMLARLLLSLLIDADRSASACFTKNIAPEPYIRPTEVFWDSLIELLEAYLSRMPIDSEIAQMRQEISLACRDAGKVPGRILRLVVPTGAGKTLSSLRFSLQQARSFGKKRIIYVAPFNSILEQNAGEFRKALGNPGISVILEHHSNLIPDDKDDYDEDVYKELTQNWSAPIILTSAVQFLNALFSAKSGAIRRMHALTDSVIIVDEVQAIPIHCIALFNMAVNFLAGICDSTIVLCSATQPPFEELPRNRMLTPSDMLPSNMRYQTAFRRTRIIDKTTLVPGGMDAETAARFTADVFKINSSILFIVNTKKAAKVIYSELKEHFSSFPDAPRLFHLSTNMCPLHRRDVLNRIRAILNDGGSVICVSTQLIEAGVDISFKAVIRSAAGVQNIIQAAGRGNRNAETDSGDVYIVRLSEELEDLSHLPEIRAAQNAFYSVLSNIGKEALDSAETMEKYYKYYYYGDDNRRKMYYPSSMRDVSLVDLLSGNSVGKCNLERSGKPTPLLAQACKTAGEQFQVIEERDMVDILVEYDRQSTDLIARLNSKLSMQEFEELLPQLQPYTVSVSQSLLKNLRDAVYTAENGNINVLFKQYYDQELGVGESSTEMDFYNV